MRFTGENVLHAPVEKAWEGLRHPPGVPGATPALGGRGGAGGRDTRGQAGQPRPGPARLVPTAPGCERLEATGENSYAMTVTAGVASIKGTYAGTCSLSDLQPHPSLVLKDRKR